MSEHNPKTYKVTFYKNQYGYVLIQAKNKEEAQELFDTSLYPESHEVIKGGEITIEDIKLFKP